MRLPISTLDGGDVAAVELLDDLLEVEFSMSLAFMGDDDARGEGFCGELPVRGRGETPEPKLSSLGLDDAWPRDDERLLPRALAGPEFATEDCGGLEALGGFRGPGDIEVLVASCFTVEAVEAVVVDLSLSGERYRAVSAFASFISSSEFSILSADLNFFSLF